MSTASAARPSRPPAARPSPPPAARPPAPVAAQPTSVGAPVAQARYDIFFSAVSN